MMKLYFAPGSCSMITHLVLEWIGQPYELEQVTLRPASDNLIKVNPQGAVPVLDDQGAIITQNVAVLTYIAEKYPEANLLGTSDPVAKAQTMSWLALLNSDFHPLFKPFFGAIDYIEDENVKQQIQAQSKENLFVFLARFDQALSTQEWLTGTRSVADAYLFVALNWLQFLQIDFSHFTHVKAFHDRLGATPAVQKVLKNEGLI